jgi:NAD+ kinase
MTFVLAKKDARTIRLLEEKNPAVKRLRSSHESHEATVEEVRRALERLGVAFNLHVGAERVVPDGHSLVVTIGGDGTLLVASHQLGPDTPILGINSAPESSVGFFCAGRRGTVLKTLRAALSDKLSVSRLSRMHVELNGKVVHQRVLNDALFCHESPAATSRYILGVRQPAKTFQTEEQRSSGIWVGPAAGSTAAQRSAGGRVLPLSSRALQFVVREPYVRRGKRPRLALGLIRDGGILEIRSKVRDGRLFLDGVHTVHTVGLGDLITMRRSEEHLLVLGLRRA